MSADLSEAVEAMARAAHDGCGCLDEPIQQWILDDARRDLTAALPFIEDAVRERIAAEIEVLMRRHDGAQIGFSAVGDAYAAAARIARGAR